MERGVNDKSLTDCHERPRRHSISAMQFQRHTVDIEWISTKLERHDSCWVNVRMPSLRSFPISSAILFAAALLAPKAAFGVLSFSEFWMELDAPHPFCERTVNLDVSSDAFFPIANEIPERDDFNTIISTFRSREWAKLDVEIREFFHRFEKTSLRQVVEFLKVYSQYERLNEADELSERKADQGLRQALLLYPRARLSPVAYAAAGQYLLRSGQYQRALEVYRTARENYGGSEFTCMLELGVLEGAFMLREWDELDATSKGILEKCGNFRIRAVTKLRVGEAAVVREHPKALEILAGAISADSPFAERFVPTSLYNQGELAYQKKMYKDAAHYFERFLRVSRADTVCGARAQKRQADIAFQRHEDLIQVTGKYLEVYDRYPQTDEGRFSKAHSMFLSVDILQASELQRRVKWVESQVDFIENEMLRFRIYLEKGIVLWMAGEAAALDYLERLQHRRVVDLKQGAVGKLIRQQLVRYWTDKEMPEVETTAAGLQVLSEFEKDYGFWMQGFDKDAWAANEFAELTLDLFSQTLIKDSAAALDLIDNWRRNPLFPSKGALHPSVRKQLGESILRWQLDAPEKSGVMLLARREALEPLLGPTYRVALDLATSVVMPDELRKTASVKSLAKDSAKNSIELLKGASDNFKLATAEVWMAEGNYAAARQTLNGLTHGKRRAQVERNLLSLDLKEEKWASAFDRYRANLTEKAKPEDNKEQLVAMTQLARDKSLTEKSPDLPDLARQYLPGDAMVNDLLVLSASAWMQRGKTDKAIAELEVALGSKLEDAVKAEAHFRIGQAFWKKNRADAAREHWQKVLQLRDSTWAPLAQNELKLSGSSQESPQN